MRRSMTMAGVSAVVLSLAACQSSDPVPDYDGRNLYLGYCASCHGAEGAGDGPVAPALAQELQDLRTLEAREGEFPRERLIELIDGRTLRAAHGTPDMPVWGWQFRLVEESPQHADARIVALVDYLEDIQLGP